AQVLLADHLLDDRTRQRLGLCARLAGLAADELERLPARPCGFRVLARATLLGGALASELALPLGAGALVRVQRGVDDVVLGRQRVRDGVDGVGVVERGVVGGVVAACRQRPGQRRRRRRVERRVALLRAPAHGGHAERADRRELLRGRNAKAAERKRV